MSNNKNKAKLDVQTTEIESKEIKSTQIQPSDIEPTDINPTEIKSTEIKPTDIKQTDIKPTDINVTEIIPTDIKPTEINATEIKSSNIKPKQDLVNSSQYKKSNSIIAFFAFIAFSIFTCTMFLINGWQMYILIDIFCSLFALVMFIKELKKMQITQEEIDEWNKKLPANNQLKLENFNNIVNKFSFWLHKLGKPIVKVVSCVAMVGACALWVITPTLYFSGIAGGSSVEGNTYTNSSYTFTFNSDKSYVQKYEGLTMDTGTWSQSGNKVTCHSNGGITIIFTVGSTYITEAGGIVWQRE